MDDSVLNVNVHEAAHAQSAPLGWNAWQLYALRKLAGDDEDSYKTVKKALYSSAVHVSFFLVGAVAFGLYFVFSAFTRPLLWATMCGACLFPLKRMATAFVLDWLASLERSGEPLIVGLFLLPFQLIKSCADLAEHIVWSNWKSLACLCVTISISVCCEYVPIWDTLVSGVTFMTWLATCTLDFAEQRQFEVWPSASTHEGVQWEVQSWQQQLLEFGWKIPRKGVSYQLGVLNDHASHPMFNPV